MFQTEALMPWRTALGNVTAGLEFRGVAERCGDEAEPGCSASAWAASATAIRTSSRAACASASRSRRRWSLDPDIILMDEPFSALDIQTRQLMENEVLASGRRSKKAVLFITHDLDEAIAMCDRVVVLSAGPGVASDRRVRDRPAAAARRRRGAR